MGNRTYERDIDATLGKRATFGGPTKSIFQDPGVKIIFGFLGEAQIGCRDALEDVVIVLGCAENAGRGIRNVPITEKEKKMTYG